MGVDAFGKAKGDGKRQAKRARVLLAAKLETPNGTIDARLRDLSRKGALLECGKPPVAGTELVFKRGGTAVPARVAWSDSSRLGLEFHEMIDESEVLVQLGRRGKAAHADVYSEPTAYRNIRGQDAKLVRAWGVTVGINLP